MSDKSFMEYVRDTFDPAREFAKPFPMSEYRGLSWTQYILGPSSANYLAQLGPEVIKMELPRLGEPMRHTTPLNDILFYPLSRSEPSRGTGGGFVGANYNEYFASIDFRRSEAKQLITERLAPKIDFVMENYRPGTFDRWGIGYRQLSQVNPRIVYVWMGGFGGWGPGRRRASYDILGQAQGGCFWITGFPSNIGPSKGYPTKLAIWYMDYVSGMHGALGAASALYWRDQVSGVGQFIEVSQVHFANRCASSTGALLLWGRHGLRWQRFGDWDHERCVHGIVKCGKSSRPDSENPQEKEEGYVVISAFDDADFVRLMSAVGHPELAQKHKDWTSRVKPLGQQEIYEALEEWAKDYTKEQVVEKLTREGIIATPVLTVKEVCDPDVSEWGRHWHQRGSVRWIEDPTFGDVLSWGPCAHMSESQPKVMWIFKPVGADNEYVYVKLCGLTLEELKSYEEKYVI